MNVYYPHFYDSYHFLLIPTIMCETLTAMVPALRFPYSYVIILTMNILSLEKISLAQVRYKLQILHSLELCNCITLKNHSESVTCITLFCHRDDKTCVTSAETLLASSNGKHGSLQINLLTM